MVQESMFSVHDGGGPVPAVTVADMGELKALRPELLRDGQLARVSGYYRSGDGGGMWMRWAAGSAKPDNGGTVQRPDAAPETGRWETVHNGTADFRWFGLFDASRPADAALEAMVNDPAIHRVEAHSDLNFTRRHVFSRSGIVLDFNGHTVTTVGIEPNTRDNPFGAVLCFRGTSDGAEQAVTLSRELGDGDDILEVADASAFAVGEWWIARIDSHPEGGAQRELDYLVKVTEIVGAAAVRFNYKLGWTLAAGRRVVYRRMNPVFRSHVRNMTFVGIPVPPVNLNPLSRPFETWDQIGSNPVAYEFAVECDVSGIDASHVFWPVVIRRYNSHYVTERCRLMNPEERDWGGTGYLTQQLNVLYGRVRDCTASNARHLNDFTCGAYCLVENCHSEGDDFGSFVTHGQFEHDLTFVNNSGMLSFANSGTTWGDSAKRITVKKHVGSRIICFKKITDMTLEDVHAFRKDGLPDSGSIWANADGLQMRGCTAELQLTLSQSSARSKRPNLADGCSFGMTRGLEIARGAAHTAVGYLPVASDFTFRGCVISGIDGNTFGSIRRLELIDTWLKGASPEASPAMAGCSDIVIRGGGMIDTGLKLIGAWNRTPATSGSDPDGQTVTIGGGAQLSGTNAERAFLMQEQEDGHVVWSFGELTSRPADANTAHFRIAAGANRLKAFGAHWIGGKFEAEAAAFGDGGWLLMTSCFEEGVDRDALPEESGVIRHRAGNLSL